MGQQELDLEAVKAYNEKVRELQEQAKRLRLERELAEKQLKEECEELSALLGEQVTPENIESVYARVVAGIKETMDRGNEIIANIAKQEVEAAGADNANIQTPTNAQDTVTKPVTPVSTITHASNVEPAVAQAVVPDANASDTGTEMDEFAAIMMGETPAGQVNPIASGVAPVQPIQPIAPVQPIQPISPVQPITPIQPVSGGAMPTFGAPTFNMPNFN